MNRIVILKSLATAALALGTLAAATTAHTRYDVQFSITLEAPGVYVQPAPVYVQPQPVYAQPISSYVYPRPVYAGHSGLRLLHGHLLQPQVRDGHLSPSFH